MKKISAISFLIILICNYADAQYLKDFKNEVTVGYGFATTDELVNAFNEISVTYSGGNPQTLTQVDESYWGGGFITYRNSFFSKVTLGLTFGIDLEDGSYQDNNGTIVGNYSMKTYTTAAEVTYTYERSDNTFIYGMVGAGYSIGSPENSFSSGDVTVVSDSYNHFNFQVTPLGVKYGKLIGGFFELGFGYKGLVNGGIYFKFK